MHGMPINLATALRLADAQALDIATASERARVALGQLQQANALWLPTITFGGDYARHDGRIQNADGTIVDVSRSNLMVGAGSGIGAAAVFSPVDAIFAPLAARQNLQARQAEVQAATNDTLVAVTDSYFTVVQARGELAGAEDATRRNEELVRRVSKLAPGLVPPLETLRAETELARRRQAELFSRERWRVASAELMRILRLDPAAQVEPLEPAHLHIAVVDLNRPVDDLVLVALTYRPELASRQALVQATLATLRQERLRPLIPSVLLRGWSTPVTGTLAVGAFGGGPNGSIGDFGARGDLDLQILWQLDNLGFGNRGRINQREAEHRLAMLELLRLQDRIAAEVAQTYAQAQLATQRIGFAERGVSLALDSYLKNLEGLGQTRRVGEFIQTVVRPQEVVAAVQALAQAYADYYGAIGDANRAQFRLYRAIGQPGQEVLSHLPSWCDTPAPHE
jgi:outer membrane protein TolC